MERVHGLASMQNINLGQTWCSDVRAALSEGIVIRLLKDLRDNLLGFETESWTNLMWTHATTLFFGNPLPLEEQVILKRS
jgi:hypothetical protein